MPVWVFVVLALLAVSPILIQHIKYYLEDRQFAKKTDRMFARAMEMTLDAYHAQYGVSQTRFWKW